MGIKLWEKGEKAGKNCETRNQKSPGMMLRIQAELLQRQRGTVQYEQPEKPGWYGQKTLPHTTQNYK